MRIHRPFSNIKLYPNTVFQKIFTLVAFCLCGTGILAYTYQNYCSPVVTSSKVGDRHLPIYCVDCGEEKKISLSFDAAWGNGRDGKDIRYLSIPNTFTKHTLL